MRTRNCVIDGVNFIILAGSFRILDIFMSCSWKANWTSTISCEVSVSIAVIEEILQELKLICEQDC